MGDYKIICTDLGNHAETIRRLLEQGERESGNFHADGIRDDTTALLAFHGAPNRIQNVVGVLVFRIIEEEPPALHARILYVKPDFQKRGIGRSLLEEAAKIAESTGMHGLCHACEGEECRHVEASRALETCGPIIPVSCHYRALRYGSRINLRGSCKIVLLR